ncbi:MAG: sulfurtransferase complex subunit TusC [Hyphomicrobiaceae bacterium]|nr:sulfurtransferase complex subunit TusC [Hyphomicrobiaceae bacterium]
MEEEWDEGGPEVVKRFMYVNRKAPYGTVYALEMLEKVLIAAAFEQDVHVVFMDDGVYQLKKEQETKAINMKNFSPTFRALEGYDVEKLYVEKESLEARGLTVDDLVVPVEVLSSEELKGLMDKQEVILTA